MQLILRPYELKLEHTFRISREARDIQESLVVELKDGEFSGYGEATANPYYGATIDKMSSDLTTLEPLIKANKELEPARFWQIMYPKLKDNMFALCALDLAFNDLYARKKGMKLYEYWGLDINNNPITDYTIGIDTIEKMVSKLKEKPWPLYKIKLGTKEDITIIKELRKHTDAVFRVDANCGWGVDETLKNAVELQRLNVEFIEQPLRADDWNGHKEVFLRSVLPIIADESCMVEADVMKCHNHFHGVNVKLTKCGGLTPAKRMLEKARRMDMKTMVGCMTESSVGISAIAHLLPLLDYVDMDGALLISNDTAEGVIIENGIIKYSSLNGTGVKLIR
ncbi:dipeptide epimerase [Aureibaculum sp. 2210JD6-5]|uniref:dipeptide epimerase n=1 Tax=Aureibaculum sp. 2210JD6-5 TaxID=3103957 RepID=UPI002AACDA33|nr:dipeptide epimerase [Aureibaculum sp. 2210JD6-5]MDY7395650.1 dipeptide epimerase [Aureibaculum sp. 2210JD6-5]